MIRNNTVSGKANNVYLKNGKLLTAYYFKPTGTIGLTTETLPTKGDPVVFCNDSDKDYSAKFVSDRDGYMVYCNEDGHLELSTIWYSVTYRPGAEGIGSESVDRKDTGESLTLRGKTFTRSGYRQIGWTLSEGGTQAYALSASYTTDAPLVLYPVWEAKSGYTVNFVNDNGEPVGTRTVAWTDTALTNAPAAAKGEGWDFNGWFFGETRVDADMTYAALAKDDTMISITLKAAWTDVQKPTVSGIEDQKTYCSSVLFTVADNDAVQKVYDRASQRELTAESDGSYTVTLPWSDFSGKTLVSLQIHAKTNDGYSFTTDLREVTVLAEHPWGEWASNHDGTHSRTCTNDPTHVDAGSCNGGEATCLVRATCAICGEGYGERNASNHSDLKRFPAKAATKTSQGNIEYWFCSGCGKYYKDAEAAQEISKEQTVTAKLPDDPKSPQTGDNSNLTLWISLLLAGSAAAAATVYGKRKHSEK